MKFQLDDVKKVQLAKAFQSLSFWMPIAFLYYKAQGYTDDQAYTVIGALQLFIVLLEYPTGVIGDVFGHKLSVLLGYFIASISFFILGSFLDIPYHMMYLYVFIFALGGAFTSGSDVALLHSVSKDFKNDMAQMSKLSGTFASVGLIIGGFIAVIDLRIPFCMSGIAFLISGILIWSVKVEKKVEGEESGFIETAILGMKEGLMNMNIFFPLFLSGIMMTFLLAEKWVLPTVFSLSNIPLAFFGVATAIVMLFRGQASGMYKRFGEVKYWILIGGMILSSLLVSIPYVSILGLLLVYGFAAYINTQSDIEINEKVDGRARASVVSFRNLLGRLFNSPYIWIIGFASARLPFSGVNIVMSLTVLAFVLIVTAVYRFRTGKFNKKIL